ncbi:MAG TPA: hypothetical protein VHK26_04885 [Methyloceanibacter sp.]|jgi:hypothetical protein|nr:hypothetical protein [Methyloceanibacter sp.]
MLRNFLVAGAAIAVVWSFTFISQPVAAGSCTILGEKAIGLKQSETSARALKQLNRKANHWANKSGYKTVWLSKVATICTKKGALYSCTVGAKACGG